MAEYPYTLEEFRDHLAALEMVQDYEHVSLPGGETVDFGGEQDFASMVPRVMDYMRQIYPDDAEALYKGTRLMMILNHVATDIEQFEDAGLAVIGSADKPALVHPRAWHALHHFYAVQPLKSGHIPTREIIDYARTLSGAADD